MNLPRDNTPESLAAYLEPRFYPWFERGMRIVIGRIEDARIHAEKALTQSLIGTPDGRKSWGKVQGSKSYQAALNRLDEIIDAIAGPTKRSLSGLASDVRAKALKEGFAYWSKTLPEPLLAVSQVEPTAKQLDWARGLVVFAQDDRSAIVGPIDAAKRSLSQAVLGAAMRNAKESERTPILDNWAKSVTLTIGNAVNGRLRNSQVAAFNATGRLIVDPKFYDESDVL